MRVAELAEWLDTEFEGDGGLEVKRGASLEAAGPDDFAFVATPKIESLAQRSKAGCLIVHPGFPNPRQRTIIRSSDPRAAFARAVNRMQPRPRPAPGVHATAVLDSSVILGADVSVGPRVSLGASSRIGDRSWLGPGAAIGRGVRIGRDCEIHPNVTIYDNVTIGDRVILHAGCVLGAEGFGFVRWDDHWEKFPQSGGLSIGNDVEIGANSCVDRAALGTTEIGDGTKLDNMVHVGHNCRIGRHVVVAAQTGFSGGVVVEDYAIIGGQVGVGDKARIETGAVLGSGCGVLTSKIIRAGQTVWGTPARPLREYLENLALLARLPEMRTQIRFLQHELDRLASDNDRSAPKNGRN